MASLPPRPVRHQPARVRGHRRDHRARGVVQELPVATRHQWLYRGGPKRAMREVLEDSSSFCAIPEARITAHFCSLVSCPAASPSGLSTIILSREPRKVSPHLKAAWRTTFSSRNYSMRPTGAVASNALLGWTWQTPSAAFFSLPCSPR